MATGPTDVRLGCAHACERKGSLSGGHLLQEPVLGEHPQPARRVALHQQRLVVDARVAVGMVVALGRLRDGGQVEVQQVR